MKSTDIYVYFSYDNIKMQNNAKVIYLQGIKDK